jgi:hypothetical protein
VARSLARYAEVDWPRVVLAVVTLCDPIRCTSLQLAASRRNGLCLQHQTLTIRRRCFGLDCTVRPSPRARIKPLIAQFTAEARRPWLLGEERTGKIVSQDGSAVNRAA